MMALTSAAQKALNWNPFVPKEPSIDFEGFVAIEPPSDLKGRVNSGLHSNDQKILLERLGINKGFELLKALDRAYPGFALDKVLGTGAYSEARLFHFDGGKRVLKLTRFEVAAKKDEAGSFWLSQERMGGEWLALLNYNENVVRTDHALAYDHTKKRFVLVGRKTVQGWFAQPHLRKEKLLVLVGTVSEYVDGSKSLDQMKNLTGPEIHWIAQQLLRGIESIHGKQVGNQTVIHRDIKPENLLISSNGTVKIIDFGFARLGNWEDINKEQRRISIVGTDAFMAPEVQFGMPYGPAADLYSAGATLFTLATGKLSNTKSFVQNQIAHQHGLADHEEAQLIDVALLKLIGKLGSFDPFSRLK